MAGGECVWGRGKGEGGREGAVTPPTPSPITHYSLNKMAGLNAKICLSFPRSPISLILSLSLSLSGRQSLTILEVVGWFVQGRFRPRWRGWGGGGTITLVVDGGGRRRRRLRGGGSGPIAGARRTPAHHLLAHPHNGEPAPRHGGGCVGAPLLVLFSP